MILIFQSARGCCVCETNCNALYYALPIETTRIVVNQAWISSKLKLIATLWKIKKELFSKHFPRHFQSFCCKIHVYWVINSLPPVCSHAIRTILMVWVRITLGFQPRVIRTQTINIFSYCMNKQGITNNIISYHIISYHIISYHIISYHIIRTISRAISKITKPILGLFVLIWMHFPC